MEWKEIILRAEIRSRGRGVTILIFDKHDLREGLRIEGMGRWMRNLCQREIVLTGCAEAKYIGEGLRTEQGRDDKKGGNIEEEHCVERKCVLRGNVIYTNLGRTSGMKRDGET